MLVHLILNHLVLHVSLGATILLQWIESLDHEVVSVVYVIIGPRWHLFILLRHLQHALIIRTG